MDDLSKKSIGQGGVQAQSSISTIWLALGDIGALVAIVAVGWFLIGYYTKFEFLQTGYQDWIYHAFRIRDISQFGIASWDHIWSNGLNHWRAFQYAEHAVTSLIAGWTGVSITYGMLWISVVVFIFIRVLLYLILRFFGIGRLISLFVALFSYETSQQWITLKDFSIFVGLIFVPLYVALWIVTIRDKEVKLVYVLTAVTGALWSVHPVVGYSASGMLALLILTNNLKRNVWKLISITFVFLVSSASFSVPYFFSGYSFSNPIFVTSQFLRDMVISKYFGLSLLHFLFLGLSWIILILRSGDIPRWAKILLFYSTAYLLFIYFGLLGYFPSFINKFQFSRAIPFIGLVLVFCFASFFNVVLSSVRSRLASTIILVLIAVSIVQSIDTASLFTAQPTSSLHDPVSFYFNGSEIPKGSIYVKDFAQSSYLGRSGLRFVNSYNQHLLPNPYPMRFDQLMKTDIAYTGATDQQIDLINDYATVLGVEYIFIPNLSPLVAGLTVDRESSPALFEKVNEINVPSDVFAVLRNRSPIANAYAFESDDVRDLLRFDELPKPTLKATSYIPWDNEIHRVAELIRSDRLVPIELSFIWPDQLMVRNSAVATLQHPSILINQSYDAGWKVDNVSNVEIAPTNLRFMYLDLHGAQTSELHLKNSWPWWHWPVQSLGIISITVTVIAFGISMLRRRRISVLK